MGGGPRTFPGGVSKWQWKRMQAKKQKQLLKARLSRERQIYEMRKRAELKAAVAELERPWEPVQKPPNLFSVCADEQVKVLADRFQKPGGFDLWTDRDGPQLFDAGVGDDLPSARFFPKGVVHSVKPYRSLPVSGESDGEEGSRKREGVGGARRGRRVRKEDEGKRVENRVVSGGKSRNGRRSSQVYDMTLQNDGRYEVGS
ncbi:copper ion transmembrane transporter [Raphanus sativus]|nr:copper ion transmembrane transporter [Raphanus sativus]KAJ4906917.1 copper ion transmembrane transporter [Raphanus sativus]